MAGRYGMSFAKKHIEEGEYEEAVRVATEEIDSGSASPDTFVDRATALDLLERHEESVRDFERALELDREAKELTLEDVDDAYFSALASAAMSVASSDRAAGVAMLARYARALPGGRHLADVAEWQKRVTGELVSTLDKTT
jgi:tetratricopeptide (TPR) repeat protein